jgi:hypothetical protein
MQSWENELADIIGKEACREYINGISRIGTSEDKILLGEILSSSDTLTSQVSKGEFLSEGDYYKRMLEQMQYIGQNHPELLDEFLQNNLESYDDSKGIQNLYPWLDGLRKSIGEEAYNAFIRGLTIPKSIISNDRTWDSSITDLGSGTITYGDNVFGIVSDIEGVENAVNQTLYASKTKFNAGKFIKDFELSKSNLVSFILVAT